MPDTLPKTVRYIKNGAGGRWWKAAKASGQLHAGWQEVPPELLVRRDLDAIAPKVRAWSEGRNGATQDVKALRTLLEHPSQHLWITFEDGCLWWCTVHDGPQPNPKKESMSEGHFWLTCDRPWSNVTLGGVRSLVMAELPGTITTTAGFRGTVCEPGGAKEILRIIQNEEDADAKAAAVARAAYETAVAKLVARLSPKDFEMLVDLILARTGWNRLQKVGGVSEGIDLEVENITSDEVAFVQVKSTAGQATLDDYLARYDDRRGRYHRMIFVVHSPKGALAAPSDPSVSVWEQDAIAHRVVKLGLADWVAARL